MRHNIFLLFLVCFLSACSSSKSQKFAALSPMAGLPADPSDVRAMSLIKAYIQDQKGPPNSRYDYTRADLNGDGLREAIFLFKGPYTYWCGWSGCMMVILKAHDGDFSFMGEMAGVRGPLVVSNMYTQGWRDLIVRVSGTNLPDRNVAMRFDGRSYPVNPASQTGLDVRLSDISGIRIFP